MKSELLRLQMVEKPKIVKEWTRCLLVQSITIYYLSFAEQSGTYHQILCFCTTATLALFIFTTLC